MREALADNPVREALADNPVREALASSASLRRGTPHGAVAMQHATKPRQLSQSDSVVWHGELPRNMSGNSRAGAYYVYIHIPKAAGASFMKDSPRHMPVGATLRGSHEKSIFHPYTRSLTRKPNNRLVLLLRHPVRLALSQFLMCKRVARLCHHHPLALHVETRALR